MDDGDKMWNRPGQIHYLHYLYYFTLFILFYYKYIVKYTIHIILLKIKYTILLKVSKNI